METDDTAYPSPGQPLTDNPGRKVAVSILGLALGTSAFFSGFYDTTTWEPILLVSLSLLMALFIARPAVPTGSAAVAIGGLLGLWLWSLLSANWTEAGDLAVTDANRWLLYGVMLAFILYLANDSQSRRWLLGATTAGVLIVASYISFRFLAGDGAGLFVANRLDGPLGYINGVASCLLVGLWPLVALAERARHPVTRGLSVFASVQLISIAVLTQSRGAVIALIASVALILVVVPGRLTRAWALLVIAGGVAVSVPALSNVIDSAGASPSADALRTVAESSLAGGVVAGMIWMLVSFVSAAVDRQRESTAKTVRWLSVTAITVIAVAALGAAFSHPGHRVDQVQNQYNTFTSLQPTDGESRLSSGGGNRYDYWRVAVKQFGDQPLKGVGAGNYNSTYYQERSTSEDIQQAHSIELQALGELGLVGGIALAAFLGAVLFGFWRTANGSPFHRANPALAVAAGGTFLVWMVQTSVDWMHLIPGLTGIALCAAAVLLPAHRPLNRRLPIFAAVLVAAVAGLAAYPVANQLLALNLQSKASDELRSDPVGSLKDSRGSISLQPAQRTYYLESAAFARLGLYEPARRALLTAAQRVPNDFVAWGLLGDLATRRGLKAEAQRYYQRASRLNPKERGLAALARGEGGTPGP